MRKEGIIAGLAAVAGTAAVIGKGIISGIKSSTDLRTQKLEREFLKEFDAVKTGGDINKAAEALCQYMRRMRTVENIEVSYNRVQRIVCLHYWDKNKDKLEYFSSSVLGEVWGKASTLNIGAYGEMSEKAEKKLLESRELNKEEDDTMRRLENAYFDEAAGIDLDVTRGIIKFAKRYLEAEIGYSKTEVKAVSQKLRETAKEAMKD